MCNPTEAKTDSNLLGAATALRPVQDGRPHPFKGIQGLVTPTEEDLREVVADLAPGEVIEHTVLGWGAFDPDRLVFSLQQAQKRSVSHVFKDGAGAYYAAGFMLERPGVCCAWSVSSRRCHEHVLEMTRISRRVIRALQANGIHRITMACMADRTGARRWYDALGAVMEGVLVGHGRNGEDFVLYAITTQPPEVH